MQLGRVEDQVWLEETAPSWKGLRLLSVSVQSCDGSFGSEVIVGDTLGARKGELVLLGSSSRIRDRLLGPDAPVKTMVLAIVDELEWPLRQEQGKFYLQEILDEREA